MPPESKQNNYPFNYLCFAVQLMDDFRGASKLQTTNIPALYNTRFALLFLLFSFNKKK